MIQFQEFVVLLLCHNSYMYIYALKLITQPTGPFLEMLSHLKTIMSNCAPVHINSENERLMTEGRLSVDNLRSDPINTNNLTHQGSEGGD